jgi:hypothetical protein
VLVWSLSDCRAARSRARPLEKRCASFPLGEFHLEAAMEAAALEPPDSRRFDEELRSSYDHQIPCARGATHASSSPPHHVRQPMQSIRLLSFVRRLSAPALLLVAGPVAAQFVATGQFASSKPDAGWVFGGTPGLTAPGVDAEGAGWLRLTSAVDRAGSIALDTAVNLKAAGGLVLSFSYAAWGGGASGGDGISVFLYDAAANMAGSAAGAGLGYCKGSGGWLGLALDEQGGFSQPQDACPGGGGAGPRPQALAVRGPATAGNPFITSVAVPGNIDRPASPVRAGTGRVLLTLVPGQSGGYLLSVDWKAEPATTWTRLINQVPFPYAAPAALRVGVAASTVGGRNIHEVRDISVRTAGPLVIAQSFEPATAKVGAAIIWTLRLTGSNAAPQRLAAPFHHELPPGLVVSNPPRSGGTCPGTVRAAPGSRSVTLEPDLEIRAAGCTVSVSVSASAAGTFSSVVPPFSMGTEAGYNPEASSAILTVVPDRR